METVQLAVEAPCPCMVLSFLSFIPSDRCALCAGVPFSLFYAALLRENHNAVLSSEPVVLAQLSKSKPISRTLFQRDGLSPCDPVSHAEEYGR